LTRPIHSGYRVICVPGRSWLLTDAAFGYLHSFLTNAALLPAGSG